MKKGFSLAEILVSISIIGILSGISIEGFMTARDRARLEEDVAKVVQSIRKAQNSALAPSRSETRVPITQKLCSIGVNINASNKTIQSIYKTTDLLIPNQCSDTNYNYGVATKLNYATINSSKAITFDIPFAERESTDSITLSLDGVIKTITVTNTGLIKVE